MTSGVAKCKDLAELMSAQVSQLGGPCEALSVFAGAVYWETWDQFMNNSEPEHGLSRLLEVRAYTETGEFHAQRSNIDSDCAFVWRTIIDSGEDGDRASFDDIHRIDRDEKRIATDPDGRLLTTGGGCYNLPDATATRVRLRNYIEYNENGLAEIVDFRIVGLERSQGEGGVR